MFMQHLLNFERSRITLSFYVHVQHAVLAEHVLMWYAMYCLTVKYINRIVTIWYTRYSG